MVSGDPRPTIRNNNAKYKEETGHLKSRTVVSVPRPPSKGSTNQSPHPHKGLSYRQILLKKQKWHAV